MQEVSADAALCLLACARRIQQGAARLEALAKAALSSAQTGWQNWAEYEHCRNAFGQLLDGVWTDLSDSYQAEVDAIYADAASIGELSADVSSVASGRVSSLADDLARKVERLFKKVKSDQKKVSLIGSRQVERESTMSRSITDSYFVGTDIILGVDDNVVGHRGGGWQRRGGGWLGPGGQVVFPPPGDIYPVPDFSDEDLIGEIESVLDSDMGIPGMPIAIPDASPVGRPIMVGGPGPRHHRHGRGWGRGWGWGYPWGPPLDYGYTTVIKEDNTLADLAIAEAIQKNTELQKKLQEREDRDWERARERKPGKDKEKDKEVVVGKGGGHGHSGGRGAQGYFRGGWFGGDYPMPFAYYGPYEDVDTALEESAAESVLSEVVEQNRRLEQQLEAKAREVGGSFEDFDSRAVWLTGKMRGGQ